MQRSFGIWHTKCFPKISDKNTAPTISELEALCVKLGFKANSKAISRIMNPEIKQNPKASETLVEFHSLNATKVVAVSKFSPVKVNDDFTVHIRPSRPFAKLVSWDVSDHENCFRMELKCIEN
jgi:hypothetical protein